MVHVLGHVLCATSVHVNISTDAMLYAQYIYGIVECKKTSPHTLWNQCSKNMYDVCIVAMWHARLNTPL